MTELKQLIANHPDCLNSRALLRSFLLDTFPNDKRTVNILTSIYESGIVSHIQDKKAITNDDLRNFTTQLEREYGVTPKYGWEYILIWAEALSNLPQTVSKEFTSSERPQTLTEYFKAQGFEVIDKRPVGGCLWVVGEKSKLETYVEQAKDLFSINEGGYSKGRATRNRYGWYTSSKK